MEEMNAARIFLPILLITSIQTTVLVWAPIFTIQAVDKPFPKMVDKPSWWTTAELKHRSRNTIVSSSFISDKVPKSEYI